MNLFKVNVIEAQVAEVVEVTTGHRSEEAQQITADGITIINSIYLSELFQDWYSIDGRVRFVRRDGSHLNGSTPLLARSAANAVPVMSQLC